MRPDATGTSTLGLRELWDAGDVAAFHGWDKRGAPSAGAA
jgi:hypothetical protein